MGKLFAETTMRGTFFPELYSLADRCFITDCGRSGRREDDEVLLSLRTESGTLWCCLCPIDEGVEAVLASRSKPDACSSAQLASCRCAIRMRFASIRASVGELDGSLCAVIASQI